jgi:hypothetical protein
MFWGRADYSLPAMRSPVSTLKPPERSGGAFRLMRGSWDLTETPQVAAPPDHEREVRAYAASVREAWPPSGRRSGLRRRCRPQRRRGERDRRRGEPHPATSSRAWRRRDFLVQAYARETGALLTALTVPLYVGGHRWAAVLVGWDPDAV